MAELKEFAVHFWRGLADRGSGGSNVLGSARVLETGRITDASLLEAIATWKLPSVSDAMES